jgi:N-methylhydantoinase A
MKRIGIDVGGTFTDVILTDQQNSQIWTVKVPTTPASPVEGALNGIRQVLDVSQVDPAQVEFVGHGTTIATNLIVEGKGARTALLTTKGFRDILEIRRVSRHDRADLYDLFFDNPPDLVPRQLRLEIDERVLYDGTVERALQDDEIFRVIKSVAELDVEAVAICCINSYVNSAHEQKMLAALRETNPAVFITASSDVNPEMFEYERTSTTVINAMLGLKCGGYLKTFQQRVKETGVAGEVLFMRSNGGLATPAATAERPVTLLESGPAGGVTAAAKLCKRLGIPNVITGDMGGTTFDVALVKDFQPEISNGGLLHTYAVRAPTIDIESIGAGGGSIAWIDAGGGVHIGPESAGADPGPACYGKGGDRATVTDCNLVLGYVDPDSFIGGGFALDADAAHRVIEKNLAKPLGKSVLEAARIVRAVANAQMAQAIRLMTVERGYDPREFAYLCFGGGGPLHAIDLAADLDIPTVIVPKLPGLFSAFGMLVADQVYDLQTSVMANLETLKPSELSAHLQKLEQQLNTELKRAGVAVNHAEMQYRADCRYVGQAEALTIDLPDGDITTATLQQLMLAFEESHQTHWNFIQQGRPVTVVNLRLQAVVTTGYQEDDGDTVPVSEAPIPVRERKVVLETEPVSLPVFKRDDLRFGHQINGPGIIEEQSSCLVFPASRVVKVDQEGNLLVTEVIKKGSRSQ